MYLSPLPTGYKFRNFSRELWFVVLNVAISQNEFSVYLTSIRFPVYKEIILKSNEGIRTIENVCKQFYLNNNMVIIWNVWYNKSYRNKFDIRLRSFQIIIICQRKRNFLILEQKTTTIHAPLSLTSYLLCFCQQYVLNFIDSSLSYTSTFFIESFLLSLFISTLCFIYH